MPPSPKRCPMPRCADGNPGAPARCSQVARATCSLGGAIPGAPTTGRMLRAAPWDPVPAGGASGEAEVSLILMSQETEAPARPPGLSG